MMDILTKTFSGVGNGITQVTEAISDRVNPLVEKTKSSVEVTLENTDNYLVGNLQTAVNSSINNWFAGHPIILWLLHHPLITLISFGIAAILIIRLFIAIYLVITNAIDRLWLWILRSPFLLLKAFFGWEVKAKNAQPATNITNYELTTNSQQLQEICDRLDILQQQQQQIIRDLERLKRQEKHIELEKYKLISATDKKPQN